MLNFSMFFKFLLAGFIVVMAGLPAKANDRAIIFFHAKWCVACPRVKNQMVEPEITEIRNEYSHTYQIDIDQYKEYSRKFKIRYIPHIVLVDVDDKNKVMQIVSEWGPGDRLSLKEWLRKFSPKRLTKR